ncbi:hypothetical protein HYQ45_011629 [Verticillium longisporum]|uniref:Infection structure specific protein n=1 Tax=Verticillium longisporum TaxID=100787 RepID=A0A8I2ZFI9_VERLO|nr:hypothetical protein HYQ45_011629 [Verticillium longisporum]
MYVSQLLLAVAAASTAAAANMAPREPTPTTAAAHVAGRDLAECSSVAADVLPQLTSAPTPDSDLARFILTEPAILSAEDQCAVPSVTGSMASEITSYASALLAWQEDHIGEFRSLWQACSDVPGIRDQVDLPTGSGSCASLAAKITGVAEPAATGTSGSDGSPAATDASASQSDNAAPRASGRALVGIAAGCLAAVGLMY